MFRTYLFRLVTLLFFIFPRRVLRSRIMSSSLPLTVWLLTISLISRWRFPTCAN